MGQVHAGEALVHVLEVLQRGWLNAKLKGRKSAPLTERVTECESLVAESGATAPVTTLPTDRTMKLAASLGFRLNGCSSRPGS